ncbi:MAG: DUF2062 domain-containing protein [Cyclobacteriaceae bacterium]
MKPRTHHKLVNKLRKLFSRGGSPRQISLAIALAVPLGIIPVYGFITPVATAIAIRWRLNVALVLGILYLVFPLQLVLFVPFLWLGGLLFQLPPLPFSATEIMTMVENETWKLFQQIWTTNLAAVGVWLLIAVPLGALLYRVSLTVQRRFLAIRKA